VALLELWVARVFCVRGIFILNEMWTQDKTYFDNYFAWLKYFTYQLVTVLAPNYTQYILSPVKVRKASIS
jgi:hypothetical protein